MVQTIMISRECFWNDIVERDRSYPALFTGVRSLNSIIDGDRARPDLLREIYGRGRKRSRFCAIELVGHDAAQG